MYSNQKHILELCALMQSHNIKRVVICPGSRNIPLIKSFIQDFTCYRITDERSAGFFALGLAIQSQEPVAICCTSGSALLNLYPAISEAVLQGYPLLILSADRPKAWINQNEDQTFPQENIFHNFDISTYNLPEIYTEEHKWYCNRLINQALINLKEGKTTHINIPISEPFFECTTTVLPKVRMINKHNPNYEYQLPIEFIKDIKTYNKRLIVLGQMPYSQNQIKISNGFVCLCDHLANKRILNGISNHDSILASNTDTKELIPELLITMGGHILSKRLKTFLRKNKALKHWHVSTENTIPDLFTSMTDIINMPETDFLTKLESIELEESHYYRNWNKIQLAPERFPYSAPKIIQEIISLLPPKCCLHLGNSSSVRTAQIFPIKSKNIKVLSNRGISGIEGCLSTAIGYAVESKELNIIILGDLSFFYDMTSLWNNYLGGNIRIIVLNNGEGSIFKNLPNLELNDKSEEYILATHQTSAKSWAEERGLEYFCIKEDKQIDEIIPNFISTEIKNPALLEVFTDANDDSKALKDYYNSININKI